MESNTSKNELFVFDKADFDIEIKKSQIPKIKIPIKPLSVNEAWQGKRFKTDKYHKYETHLLFLLPSIKGSVFLKEIKLKFTFGFSNIQSDLDNPVKCLLDIMQKKYGFNDSNVWELTIKKVKVKKGSEYILIEFLD